MYRSVAGSSAIQSVDYAACCGKIRKLFIATVVLAATQLAIAQTGGEVGNCSRKSPQRSRLLQRTSRSYTSTNGQKQHSSRKG